MKVNKYIFFSVLIVTASCQSNTQEIATSEQEVSKNSEIKVVPAKLITAEITGMTCEQGCGGSIRKNLKATGGVSKVEYDFVIDAEKQVCRIYFDDKKITDSKINSIVNTINEEQFQMKIISIEDLAKK